MESLEILILSGCSKLKKIPEFGENMPRVLMLYLDGTAITKLPTSIGHLTSLVLLNIRDCKSLTCLPSTLFNLKLLKNVDISRCSKLERLPENLGNAESVEELDVSGIAIREVPSSIGLLKNLKVLSLSGCKGLSSFISRSWYELLLFYLIPRSLDTMRLSSLLGLCSLTELNLSDCNLSAIPNDIGSLFSLKEINLSGNSFLCLPDSISQLSNLRWMELDNCRSLRSLPKLPLSIVEIWGYGCTSLETVPDLLKPSSLCETVLYLSNCSKLADNQSVIDMFFVVIRKLLQGLCLDDRYGSQNFDRTYDIIILGSVIPKWFIHQSIGAEVNMKLEPSSHLCDEWMGIAVCVVFCSLPHHQVSDYCSLVCQFVVNGNVMFVTPAIGRIIAFSDHIWLLYLLPQSFMDDEDIYLLKEIEANEFTQIGIKIESCGSIMEVKKCGFRMVYKKDIEDLNRTMAQSSNTNIIPYEGLDGKCTHGDYDGVGPSGEGSSNELPHPQRDERFTEFMAHGDSDCEEYLECSEELSDWQESSESDLEG